MRPNRVRQFMRGEITWRRVLRGLWRRLVSLPHDVSYRIQAGPGSPNHEQLASFEGKHAAQRVFILGNGPSLTRTDLTQLADELTFGLNRIYLLFEESDFRPSYFVCMNDLVLKQSVDQILNLQMNRFLNWRQRNRFQVQDGILYLRESYWPHFSKVLTKGVWGGSTVTYVALQIAYWMGFEEVILIGVDHSYQVRGTPHDTVTAEGPDPNHFDPRYFSGGDRWQLPDLVTSEMAYRMARRAFEADGRRIVDATVDGELEVFPKADYDSLF